MAETMSGRGDVMADAMAEMMYGRDDVLAEMILWRRWLLTGMI